MFTPALMMQYGAAHVNLLGNVAWLPASSNSPTWARRSCHVAPHFREGVTPVFHTYVARINPSCLSSGMHSASLHSSLSAGWIDDTWPSHSAYSLRLG